MDEYNTEKNENKEKKRTSKGKGKRNQQIDVKNSGKW